MTKDDVLKLYEAELAKGKNELDAFQGTRTETHAALQLETPAPAKNDGEDPDDHHARQKAYGKALWKKADGLVAAAGLTARGRAS